MYGIIPGVEDQSRYYNSELLGVGIGIACRVVPHIYLPLHSKAAAATSETATLFVPSHFDLLSSGELSVTSCKVSVNSISANKLDHSYTGEGGGERGRGRERDRERERVRLKT